MKPVGAAGAVPHTGPTPALLGFLLLYGALFCAYMPAFLVSHAIALRDTGLPHTAEAAMVKWMGRRRRSTSFISVC
jgi:hypothetical protein